MKVVAEELSAALATMTVKNGEELNLKLGLLVAVWFNAWLFKIKHDRYPVLVVITDETIVSICSVGNHVG